MLEQALCRGRLSLTFVSIGAVGLAALVATNRYVSAYFIDTQQ